jgi:hypothetical protein
VDFASQKLQFASLLLLHLLHVNDRLKALGRLLSALDKD